MSKPSVGAASGAVKLARRGQLNEIMPRGRADMIKFSDDGRYFWDGTKWESALSADGAWRWTGTEWIANAGRRQSSWPMALRIASWAGMAIAALLILLCLLAIVMYFSQASQGVRSAPSDLGVALVFLSLAILLASPLGLKVAKRQGLLVASSIGAGILFLGSCGGGMALVAAFPVPSPSPAVALRSDTAPSTHSPSASAKAIAASKPSPSASPSQSPSPSPSPKPAPTPTPSPTPTAVATQAPAPPAPPQAVDLCGAPSNPWGYNLCGRGSLISNPPSNFCSYFSPCVSTFWTATSGYVVQCVSGKWSHSGGVSGACSSNGGVKQPLYSGP